MMIVDGIDFPAFIRKASPNLHHAHDSGIGKGASATAAPVPADVPLFGQGGLSEEERRPRPRRGDAFSFDSRSARMRSKRTEAGSSAASCGTSLPRMARERSFLRRAEVIVSYSRMPSSRAPSFATAAERESARSRISPKSSERGRSSAEPSSDLSQTTSRLALSRARRSAAA